MCLISKVITIEFFLDIVASSSVDVTGTLSVGCFRGGSVYVVSLRFVSKQSKAKLPTL